MEKSLPVDTMDNSTLRRLLYELKYPLSQLSKEDLSKIFLESTKIATVSTFNSKKEAVKNFEAEAL